MSDYRQARETPGREVLCTAVAVFVALVVRPASQSAVRVADVPGMAHSTENPGGCWGATSRMCPWPGFRAGARTTKPPTHLGQRMAHPTPGRRHRTQDGPKARASAHELRGIPFALQLLGATGSFG